MLRPGRAFAPALLASLANKRLFTSSTTSHFCTSSGANRGRISVVVAARQRDRLPRQRNNDAGVSPPPLSAGVLYPRDCGADSCSSVVVANRVGGVLVPVEVRGDDNASSPPRTSRPVGWRALIVRGKQAAHAPNPRSATPTTKRANRTAERREAREGQCVRIVPLLLLLRRLQSAPPGCRCRPPPDLVERTVLRTAAATPVDVALRHRRPPPTLGAPEASGASSSSRQ